MMAILLMVIYTNSINASNQYVEVVTVANTIKKDSIITESDIQITEVSAYNLSKDFTVKKEDVIGKYATADLYIGDYILNSKLSNSIQTVNEKMKQLDGSKVAISITIKSFANGLSDKITEGDIVSCVVTQGEATDIPSELKYVEVLATTTIEGQDKDGQADGGGDNLATATLLVTPKQAELLAGYERNADIHLALAFRGEADSANEFLKKQMEVLIDGKNNSDNGK